MISVGKEKRLGVYANSAPAAATPTSSGANGSSSHAQFEAQVVRIWSGDQIVRNPNVQLTHKEPTSDLILCLVRHRERHEQGTKTSTIICPSTQVRWIYSNLLFVWLTYVYACRTDMPSHANDAKEVRKSANPFDP